MNIVYLNGEYIAASEAKVSVFDRGFLFSDSVYEVIPYYQGKSFQLQQHLERLQHSLDAIGIRNTVCLSKITDRLVLENGQGNQSVYLQVSRGAGGSRTNVIDVAMTPTIFACSTAITNNYSAGVEQTFAIKVVVNEDLRWQRCDIKSTSLLPNILAMQQAKSQGAQESLLQRDGYVLEGASSNFFIVEEGTLIAPKSSHTILRGTTSQLVQTIAQENNIPFVHRDIDYQQLISADEVCIASSTRGLLPVTQVDQQMIGNGEKGRVWSRLYQLLARHQGRVFLKK